MAKALFHKSQRVFVKPVGTWALIEKVVPHWVKDVDEPLRVTYECGLGRSFQSHELAAEESLARDSHVLRPDDDDSLLEHWHIARRRAKWRASIGGLGISDVGTYPATYRASGPHDRLHAGLVADRTSDRGLLSGKTG